MQRVPSITQLDYSPITGVSSPMCNTNIIDMLAWRYFEAVQLGFIQMSG